MEGKHQGPLPKYFIMEPPSFKVESATGSTLTSIYYTFCIYKVPEETWRNHVILYLDVHCPSPNWCGQLLWCVQCIDGWWRLVYPQFIHQPRHN